jgi:hypothetical protein
MTAETATIPFIFAPPLRKRGALSRRLQGQTWPQLLTTLLNLRLLPANGYGISLWAHSPARCFIGKRFLQILLGVCVYA